MHNVLFLQVIFLWKIKIQRHILKVVYFFFKPSNFNYLEKENGNIQHLQIYYHNLYLISSINSLGPIIIPVMGMGYCIQFVVKSILVYG